MVSERKLRNVKSSKAEYVTPNFTSEENEKVQILWNTKKFRRTLFIEPLTDVETESESEDD